MTKDELIQVLNALEEAKTELGEWSLEVNKEDYNNPRLNDAIALIDKSLEQPEPEPEQEPVAWLNRDSVDGLWYPNAFRTDNLEPSKPLYTSPPKREWQGLTEEEIEAMGLCAATKADIQDIEGKLKEKNA